MKLLLFRSISIRYFITAVFCLLLLNNLSAQVFSKKNYPQNYFSWPVGAQIGIAANFGELRPNHYHMGLDCRTDQKENVPVFAAADGYIAKVKIEPYGFGRCIYINHPNGLTTLYAHLNTFEPKLEKYITEQQYALKQWSIFINIPANLFPVKKGDYISASGNTGGSQGPHTHFEIRDTRSDKNLNPLLFGLPLKDNIAPNIIRLAVYDRSMSTYDQSPKIYMLKAVNGIYKPVGKIIAPSDKVSFAVTAFDRYTGSSNQNGIYGAAVFADEKELTRFELDSISYDETRYLNAHVDYRVRASGGSWLQHLSPLPGYVNGVYKTSVPNGILQMNNTAHEIKVIVADANGNQSEIEFPIEPAVNISAKAPVTATQKFYPNYLNVFDNDRVRFYLPENALYDTVNFMYKEIRTADGGTVYQLHNATVPVHSYFTVYIKASLAEGTEGKVIMKRSYGSKTDYKATLFKHGWYSASFREFGNYELLVDDVPPVVTPIAFQNGMNAAKLNRIAFRVTDNSDDIGSFTALLDGNWLRFSNDKGKNFIYVFDDHCPPGEHELKVTVTDLVGNTTEKVYNFTR